MSTKIFCGPCGYEDNIKHANKWCTNCEEGFCKDCEKVHRSAKMSRNHTIISVSDYQKIKDVAISQTCVGHGKRYDLYCSVHDKPLCIDCVDQHKSCSQLVSLDNAAANAKQSTALADLEDTINGALQNVGKFIKNQETKDEVFDKQESLIKKTVQETRDKLNQHLDVLEQKLLQDLSTKSFHRKSAFSKVIHKLNLADQKLSKLKEEIESMKQMASDIQVFIGTREINKTVSEEIKYIKDIINNTKYFDIKIAIDSSITSLLDCVDQLGIISVEERHSGFEFKDVKIDQAQKQLSVPLRSSRIIVDLQLKCKVVFKRAINNSCVSGCLILPGGNIIIADFLRKQQMTEYDGQGQYVRQILCSGQPYYLTLIDADRIAVTYCSQNFIEIINLTNAQVQKIETTNACFGIAYEDGKLFVVEKQKGIVEYDLSGKISSTLAIDTTNVMCIATTKDKIYYTKQKNNTIHCLGLRGNEMWQYQNELILSPRGVAVADNLDVFVVGYKSNNLSIMKSNEQGINVLLKSTDGLIKPRALCFNQDRKELLVCNESDGKAAVYNVISR